MRRKFIPFTKIDEETRTVAGRLTHEVVDRDDEIWDYTASVPHFKAWSQGFDDATGGKSLGNLRAMHKAISAGKLTAIDYNDADKAIDIVAKVVDDAEWDKVNEGVYTGFSVGGNVVRSWRDPADMKHKRFEVNPIEASLVDLPCVPTAQFTYVKMGGLSETRRFTKVLADPAPIFADTANRKLPLSTKSATRAALAIWSISAVRERYSEAAREVIGRNIRTAAKGFGIADVSEVAMQRGEYAKGLYEVSRLADLIQSLAWLQSSVRDERESEADDSPIPDQLSDNIADLLGTLQSMLGEESEELLAMLGYTSSTTSTSENAAMAENTTQQEVERLSAAVAEMSAKVATLTAPAVVLTEKVTAPSVDYEKRFNEATEKLAAAEGERDQFKKLAGELAETGAQLAAALEIRKGMLRAVDRTGDGNVALGTKVEKVAEATTPRAAFKAAFASPRVENVIPA